MKLKLMKKASVYFLMGILCLSLAASPILTGEAAFADEVTEEAAEPVMTDEMYDRIDGMNIADAEKDSQLAELLDDPVFLRYFDVDENGLITKKDVDMDEVDSFIMEMDSNAEGIDDTEVAAISSDANAVGCGVSGLGKAQVPAKYTSVKRSHCIDISYWQGKVSNANWKKIKAAGVTHAIIRVGYSTLSSGEPKTDSVFSNNINGAYKAGIKVGVYYYSTATTAAEAKKEAKYTVDALRDYKSKITLPVAYDYETGGRLKSSVMKKNGNASCKAFCDYIKSAGYTPMVYANYVTLTEYLDYKTLQSSYRIWLANYTTNGKATTYPGDYWMWQYSSSGKVNGLSGSIDINYIFDNNQGAQVTPPVSQVTPPAQVKSYKIVTRCKMNIRTGPSTSKKIVGTAKKGQAVYATSISGRWAKLTNGYYMSLSNCKYTAKTTTDVNYRKGPGTKYARVGTYGKGKTLTVISVKTNGWAKLSNGRYVYAKYLKIQ